MPVRDDSTKVNEALKPDRTKVRKSRPHAETVQESEKATGSAIAAITTANQAGLSNVAAHIERVKADRADAIEQVASVIAYLYDPQVLEADILTRASEKMRGAQAGWLHSNPYEGFDVQPPCLPSVASAGYLPV